MAKSWTEKHDNHAHPAHVEILDKPFAGLPVGASIVVATPKEVTAYLRRIPKGQTRSVEALRSHLARKYKADAACPLTTGIFLRIAAEAALEKMAAGAPVGSAAPFWRVVDPGSPLAKKLSCGPSFIMARRRAEGVTEAKPARRPAANKKRKSATGGKARARA